MTARRSFPAMRKSFSGNDPSHQMWASLWSWVHVSAYGPGLYPVAGHNARHVPPPQLVLDGRRWADGWGTLAVATGLMYEDGDGTGRAQRR